LDKKVTIFPKSPLCIALWIISLIFPAVLIIIAFMMLTDGDVALFVPLMSFAVVGGYLCIRTVLFWVSFIGSRITTPKHSCQREPLDVECDRLMICRLVSGGAEGAPRSYLHFKCSDGEDRRMYSDLFTEKQLSQILGSIKERGGLPEQSIEEIMSNASDAKKEKQRSAGHQS